MYDDLIALAKTIAELDSKKPRQANLRRAISTAYYAVFHYLVDEACCAQIGTQNAQKEHRHALARAFIHTSMKDACKSFNGGTLKEAIITLRDSPHLRSLCVSKHRMIVAFREPKYVRTKHEGQKHEGQKHE